VRSNAFKLRFAIILITILMGGAAYYSYHVIYHMTLASLQKNALLDTQKGATEIDHWLRQQKLHVNTLAHTDVVQSLDWSRIEPYLAKEMARFPDIQTIAVGKPDGWRHAVNAKPANVADRKYFQRAMAGQTNVSDPLISRAAKTPSIVIAAPIRPDVSANPIGEIHSLVHLNRVAQAVNQVEYGDNSYAFALSSEGKAIVHPHAAWISTLEQPALSLTQSPEPALAAIAQRMINQQQGIELVQLDGVLKYVVYLPLHEVDWSIALVIPRENVESPLRLLNLLAGVIAVLSIMLITFLWRMQAREQRQLKHSKAELEHRVAERTAALSQALEELQRSQVQMVQSEKMSSLGQLVAGVAHEINNPVSFIYGNLEHADAYAQTLIQLIKLYQQHHTPPYETIQQAIPAEQVEFIMADLPKVLSSMQIGAERIRDIVLSLRLFSRTDESEVKAVDLHDGIDSTLVILQHRLKAIGDRLAIQVVREYGQLPLVECYAGQINQVFMNILSNAIDAVEEMATRHIHYQGQITIRTAVLDSPAPPGPNQWATITIIDNGTGMSAAVQQKMLNPFFTTKPVGKGTGMGLGISYQIITETHQGQFTWGSTPDHGTEFIIQIPLVLPNPASP
jgi:two-component system, NtrC family, sensor kinase